MGFVRTVGLWVLSLSCCAQTAIPSRSAASSSALHPNVVLVTLDTTRADRMGFLGSSRGLTPNLDRLARQGTVFSRAYAQVPLTTPSHATIFTGTYPQFSQVNYMGDVLGDKLPYLPDILHKSGYRTAAFVGALVLDPTKLAPGFERGFDQYNAGFRRRRPGEDNYVTLERRGEEVLRRALAWLNKRPPGPFFLWIHLYDPHDPYTPPEPFRTRFQSAPYDGEIAYTDTVVGKLITELRTRGLFEGSVMAVVADHGEAFGEHGELHHGIFLYDETIHVPLVIKLPAQRAGASIESRVGLVDIAPTILQAVHLRVPDAMQGASLLPLMTSGRSVRPDLKDASTERAVYSESRYGHLSFGWSVLKSWRAGNYLYIEAPQRELYDQVADPAAARNVASELSAVTATAAAQTTEFRRKTASAPAGQTPQLTTEQVESLHALGYLGSPSAAKDSDSDGGADPKERIAVANLLYEGMVQAENARYHEAVPILEDVLRQEPQALTASLLLGRAYVALKEYSKAIPPLQHVVDATPDNSLARYELGCALVKTGKWDEAAPQFEAAVSQMQGSSMMHFYLALVYQRTSRIPEAAQQFQDALQADPANFHANLLLGRLLLGQNRAKDAIPYLQKAERLRPDAIDAHRFLADVYAALGQQERAQREIGEAQRIQAEGGSRLGTPKSGPDNNDLP